MTKTVRLASVFSKACLRLKTKKPFFRYIVDSTTLDRSTIDIAGTAMYSYDEIKNDLDNVNILNQKIDSLGQPTRDESSIHSTISVNVYIFEDENSQMIVPNIVADDLISKNIAQELI